MMKRTVFHILSVTALTALLTATSEARQAEAPPQTRPRGAAQQAQRDAAKAAKQTQQQSRSLAADQPTNPPKRNEQLPRNRIANAVVDRYIGGFQNNVGLNDEQTQRLSGRLGNYVRKQLEIANQRNAAMNRLKQLNVQNGSDEEIQAQYKILETTEAQQINVRRRFYAELDPELSVQQRGKLRTYMDSTDQEVRNAIQKSLQSPNATPGNK